jgi:hypothetical protein
VFVERRFRDAGARCQLVDTDVMDAAMGEKLVGGVEDAFARALSRFGAGESQGATMVRGDKPN